MSKENKVIAGPNLYRISYLYATLGTPFVKLVIAKSFAEAVNAVSGSGVEIEALELVEADISLVVTPGCWG